MHSAFIRGERLINAILQKLASIPHEYPVLVKFPERSDTHVNILVDEEVCDSIDLGADNEVNAKAWIALRFHNLLLTSTRYSTEVVKEHHTGLFPSEFCIIRYL